MAGSAHVCDTVALGAARAKIHELSDSLGAAQVEISNRGVALAAARSVLSDTADRLHEEITNAEQAEERLASVEAHSADVIEANGELAHRVEILEGFIIAAQDWFERHGPAAMAREAGRVLR